MFHHIPEAIQKRMSELEAIAARDRSDGTPVDHILRQIPPETGRFIALMAASAPDGNWLEVGTSAGYSALWLSLACAQKGKTLTTIEILDYKANLARQSFRQTGTEDLIHFVQADALDVLDQYAELAFCFLDCSNVIYESCYEKLIPNLVSGGILVADNAISHADILAPVLERALSDQRIDAMIVPIGKGELLCRKK